MSNPSLSTLVDAFTGSTVSTTLWSNITGGAATLDTVNDLIVLQQPTTSGAVNSFGSNNLYDATASAIYAQVTPSANGNGATKTILKLSLDANNWASMRLDQGVFKLTVEIAGVDTVVTLPSYDANAHRWWRLRESGGSWFADGSADGLTWTQLGSAAYSWSATAVTFVFQTVAGATEASGNAATLANVNTTTGGAANPNWPLTAVGWGARWNALGGDVPLDRYVDVTRRTRDGISVGRGRQYELDQPQAGTLDVTLANTDAVLDPTNSSGPFAGHIAPYQPLRVRMQWPPTRNLLTQVQATAGDLGGYSVGGIPQTNAGPSIFSGTDSTGGQFVASASAWQGGTVMQFAVNPTATVGNHVVYTPQVDVEPGVTYSETLRARNVTASTSMQVAAAIQWRNAAGTLISTSTGTAQTLAGAATVWSSFTVSGAAPATAAFMYVGLAVVSAPASTCQIQVDGWQAERASAVSSWCCPGFWYPLYGGFSERWPSEYILSGTYPRVHPTGVDALALLSQIQLSDPLTEEINTRSPRFLYTFGDPSGSTSFTDQTGNKNPATVGASKSGAASLTAGNAITAANATTGVYTGSTETVVNINNPNAGASVSGGAASFINLGSGGVLGPGGTTFSRMIAFRYTGATPTLTSYIWCAIDKGHGGIGTSELAAYIDSNGWPNVFIGSSVSGTGIGLTAVSNVVDSNWHLLIFGYRDSDGSNFINLDGVHQVGSGGSFLPVNINSDCIGAFVDGTIGYATNLNFKGDVSFAAEFPSLLSSTDCTNLYTAWKSACSGETSGARYSRILRYAGYSGPSNVQTGQTLSMGPATDLSGTDALSALQAVVTTENGEHFVSADGTMTFRGRGARYNAFTPVYTFGERADLGEWPYESFASDLDPTRLANVVTTTQSSTGQNFAAQDATSQAAYFPRSMSRSINSTSTLECQDAADYLLSRYKNPLTRISALTLHPSAMPAMWPVALGLELGMRVRVMRRPPGVPPIQVDCFIEQINWALDDQGEATVSLMCSPADLTPYGIFASFHTTLNAGVGAGATSIVIKNGQDNTNVAAAQVGQGQQLVLGQNTANQETVTVQTVGATSPGWTTCTLILTAATTKSHSAGDVVCEPLPAGVTDPTTWDSVSQFDSSCFAY